MDANLSRWRKLELNKHSFVSTQPTYVEVACFGYRFDEKGKSTVGWIHNCGENWRSEWQEGIVVSTGKIKHGSTLENEIRVWVANY